jgi:hypothetical protein
MASMLPPQDAGDPASGPTGQTDCLAMGPFTMTANVLRDVELHLSCSNRDQRCTDSPVGGGDSGHPPPSPAPATVSTVAIPPRGNVFLLWY